MRAKSIDINSLVRENVAKLKPYSSARDEFTDFDEGMVFLDANENPFKNDLNRYPDPYQNKLKKNFSDLKNIPLENILLGNGSDEVLDLIFRAFCEPKEDNIITMPPTYGMYKVLSEINDIENNEVLLNSDYQIDVDNVLTIVDKNSKLIFICSPNNPTGNLMAEVSIKRILENFAGLVVIDEAYIDFAEARSWIDEIENYPNLIVTQTMSKAFGMAGIRMGICYANAEIIQVLNKIKPPYNVNQLTQE
ncbi:MAG: aminotransferase class I/II-fold pyridoxal phosphate-dependent enzyme, partial [Bacteroidota bacterium]